jgi:GDP-L-fucose synthase
METGIKDGLFNVGTGQDVTIRELAETVMKVVGFSGKIVFDSSKPDGTPRKLLNVDRLRQLGWQARTPLEVGIVKTYADFLANVPK